MADKSLMTVNLRGRLELDTGEMVAQGKMRRQVEAAHTLGRLLTGEKTMTPATMPELPVAAFVRVIPPAHFKDTETEQPLYTAAQMHAYARAYAAGMAGDGERLDALAKFVESEDGLILHTGNCRGNYAGLAFGVGSRTLRQALDTLRAARLNTAGVGE